MKWKCHVVVSMCAWVRGPTVEMKMFEHLCGPGPGLGRGAAAPRRPWNWNVPWKAVYRAPVCVCVCFSRHDRVLLKLRLVVLN